MSMHKNVITLCCAAAFALGLAACSSSDDPPPPPPDPGPVEPMPSAYEAGKAAIMAAMTPEDARAAYNDINLSMVTGEEAASLMMARDNRVAELMAASAYADGKAAIMAATSADDAQDAYDDIDKNAITGAQAAELQDLLKAQLAMIERTARIGMQMDALMDAAGMLDTSDLSTQEMVNKAREAIVGLREALEGAVDVSDADKAMYEMQLTDAMDAVSMAQGGIDLATARTNQMTALSDASDELQAALAALSGSTPTQEQLDDANMALNALNEAISGSKDLTDTETAPYVREAANAMAPIKTAQMAFDDAEDEEDKANAAMMAATAAKLHPGIGAQMGTDGTGVSDRHAAYSGTNDSQISVTFGDGTTAGTAIPLSQDEDAMVADNYGWEGMMYADPAGGDMVEAVVYSDVGEPTMGKKFGGAAANDEFEYALTNGMITVDTSTAGVPARVGLTGVTRTAGTETFNLPDPNPSGATMINVPGSFHGVSGTYSCTPTTPADGCSASVAAMGFTLAGGAWTFRPGDPNARVMSAPDTMYASYGWWLHKTADGMTYTASAFFDYKGGDNTAELASGLDTLNGTATYMGGAAGKYALSSSTGGTNDAGHFTARAMLEADFTDNMISGTIDNFMGADGMARDWSVELMDTAVSATGVIAGDGTSGNTDRQMTMWTIGGMDGDAAGEWNGQLYNNGDDGVPMTAAGQFYSMFGNAGSMVGGFGANAQ